MPSYAIYTRQSRVRHDITLSSCDVQFQIEFSESAIRELRNRYRAAPHCGGEELSCDRGHEPGR
jgi:hypothetical protein